MPSLWFGLVVQLFSKLNDRTRANCLVTMLTQWLSNSDSIRGHLVAVLVQRTLELPRPAQVYPSKGRSFRDKMPVLRATQCAASESKLKPGLTYCQALWDLVSPCASDGCWKMRRCQTAAQAAMTTQVVQDRIARWRARFCFVRESKAARLPQPPNLRSASATVTVDALQVGTFWRVQRVRV